jgi:hypothetical protein
VRLGPDFKHPIRECGRKVSTRIPAFCVEKLREQLEDAKRLDALSAPIAFIAISEGAAPRAAFAPKNHDAHAVRIVSAEHASRNRYHETEAWIDTRLAELRREGLKVLSQTLESGLRVSMFCDARSLVETILNDRTLLPENEPTRPLPVRQAPGSCLGAHARLRPARLPCLRGEQLL